MSTRITADWQVDEVLRRFPATGPIFLQHGRMLDAATGQMYPTYPQMTVADYAARSGMTVERLLKALNAEVEGVVSWSRLEGLSYQAGIQFMSPPQALLDLMNSLA